jgi:beta-glucosidase
MDKKSVSLFALPFIVLNFFLTLATAQSDPKAHPWMNHNLSPDERAAMVVKQMTLDEKITLLHGTGMEGLSPMSPLAAQSNGGAGYVVGIPRLGIPGIQMSDAAYGVRMSGVNGRYSTALPSDVASAASWDLDAAYEYGALIGRELRAQGYNMSLGGGVNLTREPRNGRTFEYLGEDPVLAGKMVGSAIKGLQAQHVLGDIKHYALNDQESGRNAVNVNIDKRSARESDLLAFEIGIQESDVAAVMCSYNRVDGDYACENKYLLNDLLKKDWNFKGFVVTDWGGAHSVVKASAAGMDHEEPGWIFYGEELKKAVQSGKVPQAEVDDHVHRILRAMFATGVIDDPPERSVVDVIGGLEVAQKIAEQGTVLLKNEGALLPLDAGKLHNIAVIGPHAENADVAIVFAYQWESEGMDLESLSLPEHQDDLIAKVVAANPHTVVVLETGGPVTMPWVGQVGAILEAWFAGSRGAEAVANLLFGEANPSAKLPLTFPRNEADLPHPTVVQPPHESLPDESKPEVWKQIAAGLAPFQVTYDEGVKVGYKWYDAENKPVLFPFGYGLSYTTYSYSNLKVTQGKNARVTFTVTNSGNRAGAEVAEVYASLPAAASEPPKRLVGWSKVKLNPGESKEMAVDVDAKYLSIFNVEKNSWQLLPGEYTFLVGGSSQDLPLKDTVSLK